MTIKIQGDKITFPDDSEQTTAYDGSSGGGIPEAPVDGKQYGRQDATWTEVTGGGDVTPSKTHYGALTEPKVLPSTSETDFKVVPFAGDRWVDGKFIADTKGSYDLNVGLSWSLINPIADQTFRRCVLFVNNAVISTKSHGIDEMYPHGSKNESNWVIDLEAGDEVEVKALQQNSQGTDQNVANTQDSYVRIAMLGGSSSGGGSGDSIWTKDGVIATCEGVVRADRNSNYINLNPDMSNGGTKAVIDSTLPMEFNVNGNEAMTISFDSGDDIVTTFNTKIKCPTLAESTFLDDKQGVVINSSSNELFKIDRNIFSQDITVNGVRVGMGGGAYAIETNTVVGNGALNSNVTGSMTTAIGHNALKDASGGGTNTAVGAYALGACTGSGNTSIGESAGSATLTGNNNTLIGSGAQPSASDVSNEVTIGNGTVNKVRMGNGTVIGGGASVTFDNTVSATMRASNNVSGVSRTDVGVYEVSFIRPMSSDSYTCVANTGASDGATKLRVVASSYYIDKTKCRVTATAPDTGDNYEANGRLINLIVMDN